MLINTSLIKALWPWLKEARYLWLALGVIIFALVISLRPHTPEPVIRLTGLFLQLLGIGTVIWGISETRALFGHPSFAAKTKLWLVLCPILRKNTVIVAGSGIIAVAGCKARMHVTHGAGPNPTIEARIDAVEKNIALIYERITCTEKEMDEEFRKVTEALKNEENVRKTEDNEIFKKLECTGTGGIHISAIGASWLFVGVILSTAGIEIAKLLK